MRLTAAALWLSLPVRESLGTYIKGRQPMVSGAELLDRMRRGRRQETVISGPEQATVDDIRCAYRVLFGRDPDPKGFKGWQRFIGGITIIDLVGAMMDSREFHTGPLFLRMAEQLRSNGVFTPVETLATVELGNRVQIVDPADPVVGAHILRTKAYEPHLSQAITEVLFEGATFLDVGANIGWFTLLAREQVGPNGSVIALDVEPRNIDLLCRSINANNYENITALSLGVGQTVGVSVLQSLVGSNGATFDQAGKSAPGDRFVPIVSLDVLSSLFSRLDVMKIDIEGAELLALRGAEELIKCYRPIIFFEFSPGIMTRFPESDPLQLQCWLDQHGYTVEVVRLDGSRLPVPSLEQAVDLVEQDRSDHVDLKASPNPASL